MDFLSEVYNLHSPLQLMMMVAIPALIIAALVLFAQREHTKGAIVLGAVIVCAVSLFVEKGLTIRKENRSIQAEILSSKYVK